MNDNEQLRHIAAKLFWWQPPEVSLEDIPQFLGQVMTLGNWEEVKFTSSLFGWEAFKDALRQADPGVFDRESWALWHNAFGSPVPEMPQRAFLKEFGVVPQLWPPR